MAKVPITIDGILDEFAVMQSLRDRGYVHPEGYEKYKKEVAIRLIESYYKIGKKPWWRIW